MKAVGFYRPSPVLSDSSFEELTLPNPSLRPSDLLIEVKATSINPVDYKERQKREASPAILGWDGAGRVVAVGSEASGFEVGDKVFWSGEFLRPGTNAELQTVNHALVGLMPGKLGFAEAASLPLTAITAYEALFERLQIPREGAGKVLVVGGAGGVGSIAIQLLRALTDAEVSATAGRSQSKEWVRSMGAHQIVDRGDLLDPSARSRLPEFDFIFSTTHSDTYHRAFPDLLKVGGRLALIDDPSEFDIAPFKRKSQSVSWELIFSKSLFTTAMQSQGNILAEVASLIDEGKIRPTINKVLTGLSPSTLVEAHRYQESGSTIGKTVIEY